MRRGVRDLAEIEYMKFVAEDVSVAFMRRGVRDAKSVKAFQKLGPFQSPSCGAVFGTRAIVGPQRA